MELLPTDIRQFNPHLSSGCLMWANDSLIHLWEQNSQLSACWPVTTDLCSSELYVSRSPFTMMHQCTHFTYQVELSIVRLMRLEWAVLSQISH